MLSIHLKNLSFHAFHGLYEEEKILGNTFIVNVRVQYLPPVYVVADIADALNYEALFALVRQRMLVATPLLETIVMELCQTILNQFPQAVSARVSVEKTNPPIPHFEGGVVVEYMLER